MAGLGIKQDDMCKVVGIGSKMTLIKHYRQELDSGMAKARARVMETLFKMATSGRDYKATRYWLEVQGGREWNPAQRFEHSVDLRERAIERARELGLSDEDAMETVAEIEKRLKTKSL